MTRLSVNINKIATIRNARGGNLPDVTKAALDIERFGAEGITVHPRPDERHIRYSDVREIRPLLKTEFNIEGNPIPSFIDLVSEVVPDQVTLVPDAPDAITPPMRSSTPPERRRPSPRISPPRRRPAASDSDSTPGTTSTSRTSPSSSAPFPGRTRSRSATP